MASTRLRTSESVSEGHPGKTTSQISNAGARGSEVLGAGEQRPVFG